MGPAIKLEGGLAVLIAGTFQNIASQSRGRADDFAHGVALGATHVSMIAGLPPQPKGVPEGWGE